MKKIKAKYLGIVLDQKPKLDISRRIEKDSKKIGLRD